MTKFRIKYRNPELPNVILVRNVELRATSPEDARAELGRGASGAGKHTYLLNDVRNVLQIEKMDIDA